MPSLSGRIDPRQGATVYLKVMQSPDYVAALKKAGLAFRTPTSVLAILDTGASGTALDSALIRQMSLLFRDTVPVHTPTTGPNLVYRNQFDATCVIGETEDVPLSATIPVIESEFASRGFFALIGRDVLRRCILTYNGPDDRFTLSW